MNLIARKSSGLKGADFNSYHLDRGFLRVGNLTVIRVGTISADKPWMHDENYLYPLGYVSTRVFWSYVNPGERVLYKCEILEGEHHGSSYKDDKFDTAFRVTASDDVQHPIVTTDINGRLKHLSEL